VGWTKGTRSLPYTEAHGAPIEGDFTTHLALANAEDAGSSSVSDPYSSDTDLDPVPDPAF
jgi:hypothetical protein